MKSKEIFAYITMFILASLLGLTMTQAQTIQTIETSPYYEMQRKHVDNKHIVLYTASEKIFMHYIGETEEIVRDNINPVVAINSIIAFTGDIITESLINEEGQIVFISTYTVKGYNIDGDKVFYDVVSDNNRSYAFILDLKEQSLGAVYIMDSIVKLTFTELTFLEIEKI